MYHRIHVVDQRRRRTDPRDPPECGCNSNVSRRYVKPCTDVACNLLAIDLRLNIRIACDGLQHKFQHA